MKMINPSHTAYNAPAPSSSFQMLALRQAAFYGAARFARRSFTRHLFALTLLLCGFASSAQTLDWLVHPYMVVGEETGGFDRAFANVFDAADNQLVTGSFYGTADFDPGPGTANLSTGNNESDAFVAKYSPTGAYLWAIKFGGSNLDEGLAIATDADGNVYVTGNFRGANVDFDPGPGTALLSGYNNFGTIFIAKYSSSGAYLWAFTVAGTGGTGLEMKLDQSGDLCVTGSLFTGNDTNVDFDPGAGTSNHTVLTNESYLFLAKYTASGAYQWAKITVAENISSRGLHIDANDNIYIAGGFEGLVDFNFGPGEVNYLNTNGNIFVAKYNGNGDFALVFTVGGSGFDLVYDIEVDAAGNMYITGIFEGTDVDFDPTAATLLLSSAGETDGFIAKYNTVGVCQWAVAIGGEFNDSGRGLVLDNENNVYVSGAFRGENVDFQSGAGTLTASSTDGSTDAFVAKYNSDGVCAWVRHPSVDRADEGRDIAIQGNSLVVCGYFTGINADFDPSPDTDLLSTADEDALLWKLRTDGEYEWAIQIGLYPRSKFWDMSCRGIARDAAGNVYVTGGFEGYFVDFDPGPGEALLNAKDDSDIFIAKYDAAGNYLWAKSIGSRSNEAGTGIAVDATGNIYLTAQLGGDDPIDFDPGPGTALVTPVEFAFQSTVIAKYTTDGNYLFAKLIDNSFPEDIALDGNGKPYITGYFTGTDVDFDPGPGTTLLSSPGFFVQDVFIAAFDVNGNLSWAKGMGGSQDDYANDIAVGSDGSVYIAGYFNSGDADFDPGAGTATLASAGQGDFFVAKYDNTGAYQWTHRTGGGENDAANGLALDADGNLYVTGEFTGADVDFDPGAGTTLLSSAGNSDIFLAKYTASGGLLWAVRQGGADYNDRGLDVAIDGVGKVYITGDFDDVNTPQGASDVFLSQFSAQGNSLLVSGSGAVGRCIAARGDGQVVTGGDFEGTRDFDPGAGTEEFTAVSTQNDMYFGRYTFPPSDIILSGKLIWEHDDATGVGNAAVTMSGDETGSVTTTSNGTFSFTVEPGADVTITPAKTINKLNGVTTADATRIQRYVANIELLTDPYKIVAADVNKSNSVTTQDASIINQALLGNPSALTQFKTSWRFVPTSHNLNIPPWGFPENLMFTNVSGSLENQNFVGIKTGDVVAPNTNPANFNGSSASGFVLNTPDQSLEFGEQIAITFSANEFSDLAALQFALQFDVEKLALVKIEPLAGLPVSEENFGTYNISEGEINIVWSQAEGVSVGEAAPVFQLTFNVLETGGTLGEAIQLADEVLEGHAYTSTLADNKVALHFFSTTSAGNPIVSSKLELLQNRPNPFVNQTTIGFVLPESCEAQLRVFDVSGRVLFSQKKNYAAGKHEETLDLEGASGVLWYELATPFGILTKKMVAMKH